MKQSNDDILDELFAETGPDTQTPRHRSRNTPEKDPLDDLFQSIEDETPVPKKKKHGGLFAVLAVILVGALGFGVFSLLSRDPGPQEPQQIQKPQEPQLDFFQDPEETDFTITPELQQILDGEAPSIQPQETQPVETQPDVSRLGFYGRMLNDQDQRLYLQVLDGVSVCAEEISDLKVTDLDHFYDICYAVSYDHGEIFWYRGGGQSHYYENPGYLDLTLSPAYEYPVAEIPGKIALVESAAQPVVASLQGLSDYEKVKGVYDYLIDHTIYDLKYHGRTMYELFADGRAVCEGYARAAQYLLNQLDVEVLYVTGDSWNDLFPREGHAWNIVNIEGDYCQLDVTWGDPVNKDGSQSKNYAYLNTTDAFMLTNHVPDCDRLPACTTDRWGYFQMENRFLTFYDREAIKAGIQQAMAKGEREVEFRMSDADVYAECKRKLYSEHDGRKLVQEAGAADRVDYFYWNENSLCITITW